MTINNKAPEEGQKEQFKDKETFDSNSFDQRFIKHVGEILDKRNNSEFPIDAFPHRLKHLVTATNESLNFPIEYTASSILYTTSVAIGTAYKIMPQSGWEEGASLWVALVGKAGAAKSPVLKYILKPLVVLEKKANLNYADAVAEYNNLSKADKANVKEPAPIRYFVQDVTSEALMVTLSNNPRGVGLKYDELVTFWGNLERYQGNNEGLYLSGWDGDSNKIDRISRPSIEIDEMYLPVIGGTQPSKLSNLAKGGRDSSGFVPSFSLLLP